MSIQAKVAVASSALYFADKAFDAARDRFFAAVLGEASWLAWALLAGCIALAFGGGYIAISHCWWFFRDNTCHIHPRS